MLHAHLNDVEMVQGVLDLGVVEQPGPIRSDP